MLIGATFSSAVNALIIVSDSLIAGIFLGENAVSAINLVSPAYNLCVFFSMVISMGIPILYASEIGNFRKEEADKVFGLGLTASITGGIVIFLFLTVFKNLYFSFYGNIDDLLSPAMDYYFWLSFAFFFIPVTEVMAECVFTDGDELCATIANISEGVSNIVFSLILCRFIGIAGLGLGTFFGVLIRLFICCIHLFNKTNSLRPNVYFSFPLFVSVLRYSITDSCSFLFFSAFSFSLNQFVLWYFGPKLLIVVSVVLFVQETLLIFDGVGEAITPIISIYLAENSTAGVRRIWRLAVITTIAEGIAIMLLNTVLSVLLPYLYDISDPEIRHITTLGMLLILPGLTFTGLMYLLSSYYLLVDKIRLSVLIAAFRDYVILLPFMLVFSLIFGIYGFFAGMGFAYIIGYAISLFIVYKHYGKENLALLLADTEARFKNELLEFKVTPENIIQNRNELEAFLSANKVQQKNVTRAMVLFEDLLMLIYENNRETDISAECSVILSSDSLSIVVRDSGIMQSLSDTEMSVQSLRTYTVSGMLSGWTRCGKHLTGLGFNRNLIELALS